MSTPPSVKTLIERARLQEESARILRNLAAEVLAEKQREIARQLEEAHAAALKEGCALPPEEYPQ